MASEKKQIEKAFIKNERDPSMNITNPDVKEAIDDLVWPADGSDSRGMTEFVSRFPLENQYVAGRQYSSGYHIGNGYVGTAGHCLVSQLLTNKLHEVKVVFGWSGDVREKRFTSSEIFDIDR